MTKFPAILLFFLVPLVSVVHAEIGMPDPNVWTIQQLVLGGDVHKLDISDTTVIWEEYDHSFYYDGTGIYELQYNSQSCHYPALQGNQIVCTTTGGVLHWNGYEKRLIPVADSYIFDPDIYGTNVVWASGTSWHEEDLDVYLNDGMQTVCLTDNSQCWFNGITPKIGSDTIAWLSYDGEDYEVMILKDGTIQQLTHNDINEQNLVISNNGHLAWIAEGYDCIVAHYYDGQNFYQLSVAPNVSYVRGITDTGVLYTVYESRGESLYFFDGTQATFLYNEEVLGVSQAAAGANSFAWYSDFEERIYFDNGQDRISWKAWLSEPMAVWGNRLVWNHNANLYFGKYHGSPACIQKPRMDADGDCKVDLTDYIVFASEWLTCGYDDPGQCW